MAAALSRKDELKAQSIQVHADYVQAANMIRLLRLQNLPDASNHIQILEDCKRTSILAWLDIGVELEALH
jgi:hypothetical protein